MLRRSVWWLSGGGMKEYHEWHLREPLLQNYEGWRVLDDPKFDNPLDVYTRDFGGSVRHHDPIIDDPRLTHKQRVCRLYRWALREMQMWLTYNNHHQFNLGYKVVRRRFERYRYVTDPATCDMMVRETQKYLRNIACWEFLRNNATSPHGTAALSNLMMHPDGALVYDHWTQTEVLLYDDAKLHRWMSHHPNYGGTPENYTRFYDHDVTSPLLRAVYYLSGAFLLTFWVVHLTALPSVLQDRKDADDVAVRTALGTSDDDASASTAWCRNFSVDLTNALYAEERSRRTPGNSMLQHDWDRILGLTTGQQGLHYYDLSHMSPEEARTTGVVKLKSAPA